MAERLELTNEELEFVNHMKGTGRLRLESGGEANVAWSVSIAGTPGRRMSTITINSNGDSAPWN